MEVECPLAILGFLCHWTVRHRGSRHSWSEPPDYQEEIGLVLHKGDKEDFDAEGWTLPGVFTLCSSSMF